jgi:hypothetical protein
MVDSLSTYVLLVAYTALLSTICKYRKPGAQFESSSNVTSQDVCEVLKCDVVVRYPKRS